MRGVVSFHPVDLSFFDDFIGPLWDGRKVNPESFLRDAIRLRHVWWEARRYARGLEQLAEAAATPPVVDGSSLWTRVRTSLERFDHRPDERAAAAARHFEVELHGRGRPFFIAEASADRVADLVERYGSLGSETDARAVARAQLQKLDPVLEEAVQPVDGLDLSADLVYRNDLLRELREVFDLARAVKSGATPHPTPLSLEDLPWRIATLHARVRPFWIGDDVDGLETVCRAAGISAPDCLAPA